MCGITGVYNRNGEPVDGQALAGSPVNIIHVIDSMEVGGAEQVVATLCRLHQQDGNSSEVHCLFRAGELGRNLQAEGFRVVVYGIRSRLRLARALYREFRRLHPDVVHCHNRFATLLGAPAARLAGVPAVLTTRHGEVKSPRARLELKFWLSARFCDYVVAVSALTHANSARGVGAVPAKLVLLRNGAAPAQVPEKVSDSIAKSGFTLIHVARMHFKKDQTTLLRAFALARARMSDLHLWLLGDGPDRPALEHLAAELRLGISVLFLGERNDVGRWLAAADLFVLSSISEGAPISLLEAMAAGLPQVVTDVGGMPEILGLSRAGWLVPPANPDALAQAILEAASRREELPRLAERARLCYEHYFTPDRMAREYLHLYRERLQGHKRVRDYRSLQPER